MCYDDKAVPPVPPGESGVAHGEDLVLTTADGNRFAAYVARPEKPANAQIVIYPDVRGLHSFYKQLALRFAGIGVTALAIDYFGRTAGLTERNDAFEYMPHVQQLQLPTILKDTDAALAYLRTGEGTHLPTFIVGFCLGGSLSLLSGTQDLNLTGLIAFYAGLARKMAGSETTILEEAVKVKYPVLGLFGGADQGIPVEQVTALDDTLDKAGVQHEIVIYPNAPHSFFDRRASDFAQASENAWERIRNFIAAQPVAK